MLCVTVGRTRHKYMIAEYQSLAEQGADLVELRLDYVGRHIDLSRLLATRFCPVVITCRRREDGGRWEKSESERLMILRTAIASSVDFVDLEEDIAGSIPRYGSTKRIVSYHNFDETPEDLDSIYTRLAAQDADIVKIATMANNFSDCIRMLELMTRATVPTIGLCMGETGVVTRILALKYGAPFTFTAMSSERKAAPGQLPFTQMRDIYRPGAINEETRLFGVVADPVAHSLSPLIHNSAFAHDGLNYRYLPFRIAPEDLELFMHWCREVGIAGLSVTIPHKEAMLKLVNAAESAATGIGAINTVAFRNEDCTGYNTDYRAAMDCLTEALQTQRTLQKLTSRDEDLFRGRGVMLLGAGGVARAIGYGLRQRGAVVAVSSRTLERSEQLARDIGGRALPWENRHDIKAGILVNCSPIGMHPDIDRSPYDKQKFLPDQIVFDTVYNPEQTLFIKEARAAGCFVINGLDMFVRQAAYQYKLFTGREPNIPLMRQTVKRATSAVNF
jgi:3-dehydroquinate dehydratase / shikimate dehydrogenase